MRAYASTEVYVRVCSLGMYFHLLLQSHLTLVCDLELRPGLTALPGSLDFWLPSEVRAAKEELQQERMRVGCKLTPSHLPSSEHQGLLHALAKTARPVRWPLVFTCFPFSSLRATGGNGGLPPAPGHRPAPVVSLQPACTFVVRPFIDLSLNCPV